MKTIILSIVLFMGVYVQQTTAQDKNVKAKFNQTLDSYYALKNALATDKEDAARTAAVALQAAVKAVPHKGFANDTQHQLWMEQSGLINTAVAELVKADGIKNQRTSFKGISNAIVKLAEELKLNTKEAYVQYCPMVKASWLNEVKAVQNPYYGSMMYDCGSVKSTIAGK